MVSDKLCTSFMKVRVDLFSIKGERFISDYWDNIPNWSSETYLTSFKNSSWFFAMKKFPSETKGKKGRQKMTSLSSSSLHEIKIIMGTLYNYDLISFMLMVDFLFSLFILQFSIPLPRVLIVNLYFNLFNRRGL